MSLNFSSDWKKYNWHSKPTSFDVASDALKIFMDAKTDFWQKTYYKPTLVTDNGHFLSTSVAAHDKIMLQTTIDLQAKNQFDQAGLMIRTDENHWLKAGLEYVDGEYRLSCVVTNTYSDWSTQSYSSGCLSLRLYKLGKDVVIPDSCQVMLGPFACAPSDKGGQVLFSHFALEPVESYHHTN